MRNDFIRFVNEIINRRYLSDFINCSNSLVILPNMSLLQMDNKKRNVIASGGPILNWTMRISFAWVQVAFPLHGPFSGQ
jgi:hypothetical protein